MNKIYQNHERFVLIRVLLTRFFIILFVGLRSFQTGKHRADQAFLQEDQNAETHDAPNTHGLDKEFQGVNSNTHRNGGQCQYTYGSGQHGDSNEESIAQMLLECIFIAGDQRESESQNTQGEPAEEADNGIQNGGDVSGEGNIDQNKVCYQYAYHQYGEQPKEGCLLEVFGKSLKIGFDNRLVVFHHHVLRHFMGRGDGSAGGNDRETADGGQSTDKEKVCDPFQKFIKKAVGIEESVHIVDLLTE